MNELPVVGALRTLSIFGADQGAAYREHFSSAGEVLGEDIRTRLVVSTEAWAADGTPGVRFLTGNAGTGKTAAAEAFCRTASGELPAGDELAEVAPGRWVIKDLSGQPNASARAASVAKALQRSADGQVLVCANEGVLRDAATALHEDGAGLRDLLEIALREGAGSDGATTIINLNRQRPTAPELWDALLDYVTATALWDSGCDGCPHDTAGCPLRANAAALRNTSAREGLRSLVRLGTGEAVPTLREVLAILARAIVGDDTCESVRKAADNKGRAAFNAEHAYFARVLGHGLALETIERSPLLAGMRQGGLGDVADLQVDEWLRDTSHAPHDVQELAGYTDDSGGDPLAGTRSPHDRVGTAVGTMTFHALGETVSTSEDLARVEAGLDALVGGETPRQALWRRRIFFEAPAALGGADTACSRLLEARHLPQLAELARLAADGKDTTLQLTELVRGLNFLVCGFSNSTDGLVVPDQSCLFARDPGSFRPARPSLVQRQIDLDRLSLRTPDSGLVLELLDVDPIEVDLVVSGDDEGERTLRIRPRLHEAIRLAALYQGPVGQGIAEMADLRAFYGELANVPSDPTQLRIADPNAEPPALITVRLPHTQADA